MTRKYNGLRDSGQWEEFEADKVEDARPSVSGYKRVEDAETGEEVTDDAHA